MIANYLNSCFERPKERNLNLSLSFITAMPFQISQEILTFRLEDVIAIIDNWIDENRSLDDIINNGLACFDGNNKEENIESFKILYSVRYMTRVTDKIATHPDLPKEIRDQLYETMCNVVDIFTEANNQPIQDERAKTTISFLLTDCQDAKTKLVSLA